jgi:hypothetical protein
MLILYMEKQPNEAKVVSDRKIVPVQFYKNIGLLFFAAVCFVGTLYTSTYLYLEHVRNKPPLLAEVNPADLPVLSTTEVESYRASVPRVYAVSGFAGADDATTTPNVSDGYVEIVDAPVVEVDESSMVSLPAVADVFVPAPTAAKISAPTILASGEVSTAEPLVIYVEGDDIKVTGAEVEQPQRQDLTQIISTATVVEVDSTQKHILVTVEGELMNILIDGSMVTTAEGRRIQMSDLRANDVLSVSGQKLIDAPMIVSAALRLVGVQEFIPAIDLGL